MGQVVIAACFTACESLVYALCTTLHLKQVCRRVCVDCIGRDVLALRVMDFCGSAVCVLATIH